VQNRGELPDPGAAARAAIANYRTKTSPVRAINDKWSPTSPLTGRCATLTQNLKTLNTPLARKIPRPPKLKINTAHQCLNDPTGQHSTTLAILQHPNLVSDASANHSLLDLASTKLSEQRAQALQAAARWRF